MSRYARPRSLSYSFGPGPITPAVKWIIWINVGAFVATVIRHDLLYVLGVIPQAVVERFWVWQPITYMFMHAGPTHILFNMLGIWMFGVTLERVWGTKFFLKYYAVTGVGAGLTVLLVSLLPFDVTRSTYAAVTIGASGALYGLLMAFAMKYPDQPILLIIFPVPAKYFVMIVGAMALLFTGGNRVSNAAHLGGLIFGYLYLKNQGGGLTAEMKYRYLKWKMNRLRRKFDVYSGGRSDYDRHIH